MSTTKHAAKATVESPQFRTLPIQTWSAVDSLGSISIPRPHRLADASQCDRAELDAPAKQGSFTLGEAGIRALEVFADLLDSDLEGDAYVAAVQRYRAAVEEACTTAFATGRTAHANLRQTYLQAAAFYELAGADAPPIGISNVTAVGLRQNPALRKQFFAQLPHRTSFDQGSLVQLVVLPDWPGSEAALAALGVECYDRRATLVTAYRDVGFEEAKADFAPDGEFGSLTGKENWKKSTVLTWNHVIEPGGAALSPAVLLGGLLLQHSTSKRWSLAITPSGKDHPIAVSFLPGLRARSVVTDAAAAAAFRDALVPVVQYKQVLALWGARSLNCDTASGEAFFAVFRTVTYLTKLLVAYLNDRTFQNIGTAQCTEIANDLQRALGSFTGNEPTDLLDRGRVVKVERSATAGHIVDVKLEFVVKAPTEILRLQTVVLSAMRADGGGHDVSTDRTS